MGLRAEESKRKNLAVEKIVLHQRDAFPPRERSLSKNRVWAAEEEKKGRKEGGGSRKNEQARVACAALCLLCVCSDIVVHIEVLRIGRRGHEQEHLSKLERVRLPLDFEVSSHEDQNARRGFSAVDRLDCVHDRLEWQGHKFADDGLRTAETRSLEGQKGHRLLQGGGTGKERGEIM